MRQIIAAINMTLDGYCDHTAVSAGPDIHNHYRDLIIDSGVILYGRKTFELMEFWRPLAENPSGDKTMDEFAAAIDKVEKIVFSNTLKNIDWHSARLSDLPLQEKVSQLKQQTGKDVLVGSRSLIVGLANLDMIDEYQLCIHPVIAATGLPLFDRMNARKEFKLLRTKTFDSGAMILYYKSV